MNKQLSIFSAAVVAMSINASAVSADTLAHWTFETSLPTSSGPFAAEVGSGVATGFHASASAVYSNPTGDGSAESFSSNFWAVGDYYQFQVNTLGYTDVMLSWDQVSSSTGPRDFKLSYSVDGSAFSDVQSYSVRSNSSPAWSSLSRAGLDVYSFDLSSLSTLDNQASVYFRLVDISTISASGGTVGTSGTDRVDNFLVTAAPVPEADTYAFMAVGLGLLGLMMRRRKA